MGTCSSATSIHDPRPDVAHRPLGAHARRGHCNPGVGRTEPPRPQSPWWNTQAATARARRAAMAGRQAAIASMNEQAENQPQLQTLSPEAMRPNPVSQHARPASNSSGRSKPASEGRLENQPL